MTEQSNSLSLNLQGLDKEKASQYGSCQENAGDAEDEKMPGIGEQPIKHKTSESQLSGGLELG